MRHTAFITWMADEAAEAVVNGVAERQQTGLTEQDVVGQREDDRRSRSG